MSIFKNKSKTPPRDRIKKHLSPGVIDVFFLVEGAENATADEVTESAIELLDGPKKVVRIPRRSNKDVARAVKAIDVTEYNVRVRRDGLAAARKAREEISLK